MGCAWYTASANPGESIYSENPSNFVERLDTFLEQHFMCWCYATTDGRVDANNDEARKFELLTEWEYGQHSQFPQPPPDE